MADKKACEGLRWLLLYFLRLPYGNQIDILAILDPNWGARWPGHISPLTSLSKLNTRVEGSILGYMSILLGCDIVYFINCYYRRHITSYYMPMVITQQLECFRILDASSLLLPVLVFENMALKRLNECLGAQVVQAIKNNGVINNLLSSQTGHCNRQTATYP